MANNLDDDIDVEFRFYDGENSDGSLLYIYGSQKIYRQNESIYKIKTETRKDYGLECTRDSNGVVDTLSAPIQFSLSTLSQYTICDSLGFNNQYGGEIFRYQIYQIGTSCGDYHPIDISEGY